MAAVAAMAAAALAASCAVPLGPGHTIERQRLEVAFVPAPQPRVEVRAEWRVENTGDRPLSAVEVQIPDAETHGLSRLRLESAGTEVAPGRAKAANALRLAFAEPLPIDEGQEIAVSYALAGGAGVVAEDAGFVLPPGAWAPALLGPGAEGSFASGSEAPKKWDMTVRVPAGFRVYAGRRERGKQKEGDSEVFRFQQRRGDGLPFAAGGAYQEERIATAGGEVIFWTRQAMPPGLGERVAATAAGSAEFYNEEFGPRAAEGGPVHVIECVSREACWAVPGAALLGREMLTTEFPPSGVRELNRQLARTWLDFRVHPDWREEPYPMGALADYAADLAAARSQGEGARRQIVHELLEEFDRLEKPKRETSVLLVRLTDPEAVRRAADLKSEMFFFALEDAAGNENLQRGLQHLLGAYAGGEWRASDLRSAVELESGKDLGALFRAWLTEIGVPADFRSRY